MPTGAASRVEGDAERKPVEDVTDDRLLELEQLIPRLVVGTRPSGVALLGRQRRGLDALAEGVD